MGKKGKQETLPGMEARDVPEIEQAAENYRKIRDERCELSKQEAEAKAALIQVMKNKGRSYYSYNGLNVQLSNQENVKVKAKDEDDEEPVGTFTRTNKTDSPQQEYLPEADESITDEERERLHREAVARWRRERPASTETEEGKGENYQAEWLASLSADELLQFHNAPCSCGDIRVMHDGDEHDGKCVDPDCECEHYHCSDCDTKGGHQADCDHYVLGEGTPAQDEEPTIEDALHAALHHVKGASARWRRLQESGAADEELQAAIGHEFGISGGSSALGGYSYKGGKSPQFTWFDGGPRYMAQKLTGKRLLAKVRDVMGIGAPGQSNDPDADHSAVYADDEIEAVIDSDGGVSMPSAMDVVKAACTGTFQGGHQVTSGHPLKVQEDDDFTAPRCDECKRTDGAHTKECSKNSARLTPDDYLAYAQAHYKTNHQSHARKMSVTGLMEDQIREWKQQQQAGNQVEPEPEPKKTKRAKLSPVEAAIDR